MPSMAILPGTIICPNPRAMVAATPQVFHWIIGSNPIMTAGRNDDMLDAQDGGHQRNSALKLQRYRSVKLSLSSFVLALVLGLAQ
ncbi:hypothetical protein [Candidatus Spongiihabitans sp.]|uniref:hypothetical protein n=1 Tax=Candidatus Spongiihabitans sp. TaxID=3101308 RepID=UPI003C7CCAB0